MKKAIAFAVVCGLAPSAHAEEADTLKLQGLRTIDTAERILTAIERMGMYACHVTAGLEDDNPTQKLLSEVEAYESSIRALREGDNVADIPALRAPAAVEALSWLEEVSPFVINYARYASNGEFGPAYLNAMHDEHDKVVYAAEGLVEEIGRAFMHGRMSLLETSTLDNLGHLRAESDLLDAEYCMVLTGTNGVRDEMAATLADFDRRLTLAEAGSMDEKILPPSPALAGALRCIRSEFEIVSGMLSPYVSGETSPTLEELREVNGHAHTLEHRSHAAMELFEGEIAAGEPADPITCDDLDRTAAL
ncbi:hypothetical protein [Pontivivens ytuae]|uniref:DUF2059 domain-containing protein n=1 Tax=Pontivivens ytuae TaxID=2789856 RepID=A0A7S9QDZ7_9RHOB|nr:hypothetical protein [Pontivivens ytuae]QPH55818.1 hypothetical protein I0K15_08890 [Pontivivens ytuae]